MIQFAKSAKKFKRQVPLHMIFQLTLGPVYNEFGYNEHPTVTRFFFTLKPLRVMLKRSVTMSTRLE